MRQCRPLDEPSTLAQRPEHDLQKQSDLLRKRLDKKYDLQVKLYETERNFVEYPV